MAITNALSNFLFDARFLVRRYFGLRDVMFRAAEFDQGLNDLRGHLLAGRIDQDEYERRFGDLLLRTAEWRWLWEAR